MPYYRQNKPLNPWPSDWDLHLLKTCELFFDGTSIPSIDFVTGCSMFDSITLDVISGLGYSNPDLPEQPNLSTTDLKTIDCRILFVCSDKIYTFMCREEEGKIVGLLFRNEGIDIDQKYKNNLPKDGMININTKVKLLSSISSDTPYECVETIKAAIAKDYWDNNDDDDDGNDDSPLLDPVPTGGIKIQPVF